MYKSSILKTIGDTPLIKLNKIKENLSLDFNLFAKVESFNPGNSIKDRVALQMILDGLEDGTINDDSTIVEATSGNTGIGLALVCNYLKLKLIVIMPENMTIERQNAMKIYNAKVILTPKAEGMEGSKNLAIKLCSENKNYYYINQFENRSNIKAHYLTGREILNDLDNDVSLFVAGIGTGGTITGVSKVLKNYDKNIKVIGFEPLSSPLLTKGKTGPHNIPGIGANFIPKNLDLSLVDQIITVSDDDAKKGVKLLLDYESILAGISSGACLMATLSICKNDSFFKDKNVVCLLPDTGNRYLSMKGVYYD